jgi:hypothetical protein
VGADRQHALLLALATDTHRLRQQQDLLHEFLGRERPEQDPVDPAFDDMPHERRSLVVTHDQSGDPAVLVLDLLQKGEAPRHHRIDDHQVEMLDCHQGGGGLGCGGSFQVCDRQVLEDMPSLPERGFVTVDEQDAQRLIGRALDDAEPGLFTFWVFQCRHGVTK